MRRRHLIGLLITIATVYALFVGGFGTATGQSPTDPDFWMHCVGDPLSCDEAPVPTVTETQTVTVTTEAPPTTTSPDPPSQPNIVTTANWTCTGFQDRALVRVTVPLGYAGDAVNLRADCHGTIDRIEITNGGHDGFDINSASPAPHDFTVGGGFVRCRGASSGAHQDGIQFTNDTAARNIRLEGVVFSGCDTQHVISSSSNVSNVVCDGCTFLPEHNGLIPTHPQVNGGPANAMILTTGNGGTRNSLVCVGSRFNHGVRVDGNPNAIGWVESGGVGGYDAQPAPGSGNTLAMPGDPRCLGPG